MFSGKRDCTNTPILMRLEADIGETENSAGSDSSRPSLTIKENVSVLILLVNAVGAVYHKVFVYLHITKLWG